MLNESWILQEDARCFAFYKQWKGKRMEWLPGNPDYEISGNANVEWYDCMNGEKTDPDYHSAIWLPVKRK